MCRMIDHLGINCEDIEAAKKFYDTVLGVLGHARIMEYGDFVGQDDSVHIPVMDQLDQMNLLVGVGFMAVGFTYATKWE